MLASGFKFDSTVTAPASRANRSSLIVTTLPVALRLRASLRVSSRSRQSLSRQTASPGGGSLGERSSVWS